MCREFEWDNNVIMQLSSTTQLLTVALILLVVILMYWKNASLYDHTWRNSNFDVIYQRVDELDFII